MIWTLNDLIKSACTNAARIDGKWLPARPNPGPWNGRVKAAWEVFRGRADAVRWPGNQ